MKKILPTEQITTKEQACEQYQMIKQMSNISTFFGKVTWFGTHICVVWSLASYLFRNEYFFPLGLTTIVSISNIFFDLMGSHSAEHILEIEAKFNIKFESVNKEGLTVQDDSVISIIRVASNSIYPFYVDRDNLFQEMRLIHSCRRK